MRKENSLIIILSRQYRQDLMVRDLWFPYLQDNMFYKNYWKKSRVLLIYTSLVNRCLYLLIHKSILLIDFSIIFIVYIFLSICQILFAFCSFLCHGWRETGKIWTDKKGRVNELDHVKQAYFWTVIFIGLPDFK